MFVIKHFKDLSIDEFFEIAKARYEVFACEQKITQENDFDDIDKNHDGKVTNQEIQAYGVESDIEKRKIEDRNRLVNNMSMYYDVDDKYEGSLLDYRYLDDDNT